MNLSFNNDIGLLLKMYDLKGGTIAQIARSLDIMSNGKMYKIKGDLLRYGILVPTKKIIMERRGRGEKPEIFFEVNHNALDQLLCGELPTRVLYERVLNGKMSINIKPKNILKKEEIE